MNEIEKLKLRKTHILNMQKEQKTIQQMTDAERWEYFEKKNNPHHKIRTYQQYKKHLRYLEQGEEKYKNMYL